MNNEEIISTMLDWAIGRRDDLRQKKASLKDVQSQQSTGGKIKAYEEVIGKLQDLKSLFLKEPPGGEMKLLRDMPSRR